MSLIHTCELNGVNSFDYLVALQRAAATLAPSTQEWIPWDFANRLAVDRGSPDDSPATRTFLFLNPCRPISSSECGPLY